MTDADLPDLWVRAADVGYETGNVVPAWLMRGFGPGPGTTHYVPAARLDALRAELEAARASLMEANIELQRLHAGELPGGWTGELMGQIEARHKVERELAAARADAARYRWLRGSPILRDRCFSSDGLSLKCGSDLDAAIDAARKERT